MENGTLYRTVCGSHYYNMVINNTDTITLVFGSDHSVARDGWVLLYESKFVHFKIVVRLMPFYTFWTCESQLFKGFICPVVEFIMQADIHTYMFVVNFDALARASNFRIEIERRHVVCLCWVQDSKLGGLRHQIASRLNAHSQTDWAIWGSSKNLDINSRYLWWVSIQPTWRHCRLAFAPGSGDLCFDLFLGVILYHMICPSSTDTRS